MSGMTPAHCWHPRRWEGLPGKGKSRPTLITDRCCWCAVERKRTAKTVPAKGHGKHVDERDWVDIDADEAPACKRSEVQA